MDSSTNKASVVKKPKYDGKVMVWVAFQVQINKINNF